MVKNSGSTKTIDALALTVDDETNQSGGSFITREASLTSGKVSLMMKGRAYGTLDSILVISDSLVDW